MKAGPHSYSKLEIPICWTLCICLSLCVCVLICLSKKWIHKYLPPKKYYSTIPIKVTSKGVDKLNSIYFNQTILDAVKESGGKIKLRCIIGTILTSAIYELLDFDESSTSLCFCSLVCKICIKRMVVIVS